MWCKFHPADTLTCMRLQTEANNGGWIFWKAWWCYLVLLGQAQSKFWGLVPTAGWLRWWCFRWNIALVWLVIFLSLHGSQQTRPGPGSSQDSVSYPIFCSKTLCLNWSGCCCLHVSILINIDVNKDGLGIFVPAVPSTVPGSWVMPQVLLNESSNGCISSALTMLTVW